MGNTNNNSAFTDTIAVLIADASADASVVTSADTSAVTYGQFTSRMLDYRRMSGRWSRCLRVVWRTWWRFDVLLQAGLAVFSWYDFQDCDLWSAKNLLCRVANLS